MEQVLAIMRNYVENEGQIEGDEDFKKRIGVAKVMMREVDRSCETG